MFVRAEMCAACHDVTNALPITNKLGKWVGGFPIERTYTEWANSAYADRPDNKNFDPRFKRDCQSCHMTVKPASHTASWIPQHPAQAKSAGAACTFCHQQRDCNGCHQGMGYGFIKVVKMNAPADNGIAYTGKSEPGDVPK